MRHVNVVQIDYVKTVSSVVKFYGIDFVRFILTAATEFELSYAGFSVH